MELVLDDEQIAQIRKTVFSVVSDSLKQAEQTRPYLNRKDIANYFGVAESTISNWASLGMPVAIINGRKMYGKQSITHWIESHETSKEHTKKPATIGVAVGNK